MIRRLNVAIGILLYSMSSLAMASQNSSKAFFTLKSSSLSPQLICSGSSTMKIPVIRSCPDGESGIAVCTQNFEVPLKLNIQTIPPISGAL